MSTDLALHFVYQSLGRCLHTKHTLFNAGCEDIYRDNDMHCSMLRVKTFTEILTNMVEIECGDI